MFQVDIYLFIHSFYSCLYIRICSHSLYEFIHLFKFIYVFIHISIEKLFTRFKHNLPVKITRF